jgi:hypothetical protein
LRGFCALIGGKTSANEGDPWKFDRGNPIMDRWNGAAGECRASNKQKRNRQPSIAVNRLAVRHQEQHWRRASAPNP